MRRRNFLSVLGGAAAWPLVAHGQQPGRLIRLAFLGPTLNNPAWIEQYQAFRTRLGELGFREGQNITTDYLSIDDPRGPFVNVAELMRSPPDLLVASGPEPALQSVVGASGFIPVIMVAINFDPVARGYVQSLARPGGNITGLVFQQVELAQKQVELLTQAFPERTRLAVLFDALSGQVSAAAEQTAKAQMVLVLSGPFFLPHRARVIELANKHRLPSMFNVKHWAQTGGLMSYGADFPLMLRRAAEYVAKILKGVKAADLPVEQPTKFELVVNLKTAKAIGIELPTAILLRADEVIE
jgi:ABC-type uncharacterized transport system substrate-binding protein